MLVVWTLVGFGVAGALFALTVSSFDRHMGRMPESGDAPEPPRAGAFAGLIVDHRAVGGPRKRPRRSASGVE